MDRHLLAAVEDFQHPFGGADLHFLPNKRMRNTVIVPFECHVVIDVHPGILPPGKFIRAFRQRQQGRLVQFFEQFLARLSQVLHFFRVEGLQQRSNRAVGFANAEEGSVAQRGQYPAFHVLHAIFHMWFVFVIPNSG